MARDNRQNSRRQTGDHTADPAAVVRQLQAVVRDAGTRLTAPTIENLDDCRRKLEEAAAVLSQLQTGLPGGDRKRDAALAVPLGALRTEIARLTILLDGAAAFHTGWVRLAGSMVSGYTADGNPAPPEARSRVVVEV
jgi:hypothetical protein